MKTIKNTPAVVMASIFTMALLSFPLQAHADWPNGGMHPVGAPNLIPNPQRPVQREIAAAARIEVSPRKQAPKTIEPKSWPVNHSQPVRYKEPPRRHEPINPGYFRRDASYYGYIPSPFPYADVDQGFVVPDGFELVSYNGETFYYHEGTFYQQVGDQLVAIPAVIGAVVDSIPQDYQIVMADGVHYLLTQGVYYQRVDQGFEVVPGPDQE